MMGGRCLVFTKSVISNIFLGIILVQKPTKIIDNFR